MRTLTIASDVAPLVPTPVRDAPQPEDRQADGPRDAFAALMAALAATALLQAPARSFPAQGGGRAGPGDGVAAVQGAVGAVAAPAVSPADGAGRAQGAPAADGSAAAPPVAEPSGRADAPVPVEVGPPGPDGAPRPAAPASAAPRPQPGAPQPAPQAGASAARAPQDPVPEAAPAAADRSAGEGLGQASQGPAEAARSRTSGASPAPVPAGPQRPARDGKAAAAAPPPHRAADAPAVPADGSGAAANSAPVVAHAAPAPAPAHPGPVASAAAAASGAPLPGLHHDAEALVAGGGAQLLPTGRGEWRLSVNPPGLGPVRVDLGLQGRGLDAQFWVGSPAVKATVEAGLLDLRGALQAGGLSLGQLGVAVGEGRRDPAWGGAADPPPLTRPGRIGPVAAAAPRARATAGLVDILA